MHYIVVQTASVVQRKIAHRQTAMRGSRPARSLLKAGAVH